MIFSLKISNSEIDWHGRCSFRSVVRQGGSTEMPLRVNGFSLKDDQSDRFFFVAIRGRRGAVENRWNDSLPDDNPLSNLRPIKCR